MLSAQLPASALAVRVDGREHVFWRSDAAPTQWRGPLPEVAAAVAWRAVRPGLETGSLSLSGAGVAWKLAVVLVRLDPAAFTLHLDTAVTEDGRGAWTVDSMPATAALAVNAGQFDAGGPWGWVVRRGRELQPPGVGPLSSAVVVDREGRVRLVDADGIAAVRARGEAVEAFQSYPAVLAGDGVVPPQLLAPGRGVSLDHRDSRLALCALRDGRLLLALTRFDALGSTLSRLPFGPTTPEMAALMGALGCRRAVLLDGGLSGQLAVRDARGGVRAWPGLRRVPMGLVVEDRDRP